MKRASTNPQNAIHSKPMIPHEYAQREDSVGSEVVKLESDDSQSVVENTFSEANDTSKINLTKTKNPNSSFSNRGGAFHYSRTESSEGLMTKRMNSLTLQKKASLTRERLMQARQYLPPKEQPRHNLCIRPSLASQIQNKQHRKKKDILGQFQVFQNLVKKEDYTFNKIGKESSLSGESRKLSGALGAPKTPKTPRTPNTPQSGRNILHPSTYNKSAGFSGETGQTRGEQREEAEQENINMSPNQSFRLINSVTRIGGHETLKQEVVNGHKVPEYADNRIDGNEAPISSTLSFPTQRTDFRMLSTFHSKTYRDSKCKLCCPRCSSCFHKGNKIGGNQSRFFNKNEIKVLSKMGVENPKFIAKPIVRTDFSQLLGEERKAEIRRMWRAAYKKVVIMNKYEKGLKATKTISTKCLIMPGSILSTSWTLVVILLLMYTAIVTPFVIAFVENASFEFTIFELCIDSLFAIDIIINFFTPYYRNNTLVTQKSKIAKNYLKGWFIIDLVACIPFHLLAQDNQTGKYNKLLRLLRVARLYRLLRLFRLVKITKMLKIRNQLKKFAIAFKLNPGWLRLLKMFIGMLFFVHIFSCGWFMTAKLNEFAPDTWVVRYGYRDVNMWRQYLAAIYCIFQTITTVGYGDIVAITTTEQSYSVLLMALGVAFYSFAIGNITSIVSKLDHHKRKLQIQLSSLRDFAKKAKLPIHLLIKIRNHIEHKHQDLLGSMNQEALLKDLPATLRAEVITYTHRKLIQKVHFFSGKDPEFLWQVLPKLKPLALRQSEILFREGDYAEEGSIKMISEGGYLYKTYNRGEYFGEIELLHNYPRESSARAEVDSEILLIEKDAFLDILEDFPDIKDDVLQLAGERDELRLKLIDSAEKCGLKLEDSQYQRLEDEMQRNLFNDAFVVHSPQADRSDSEETHSRKSSNKETSPGASPQPRRSIHRRKGSLFSPSEFIYRRKSTKTEKSTKNSNYSRTRTISPSHKNRKAKLSEINSEHSIKTEISNIVENTHSFSSSSISDPCENIALSKNSKKPKELGIEEKKRGVEKKKGGKKRENGKKRINIGEECKENNNNNNKRVVSERVNIRDHLEMLEKKRESGKEMLTPPEIHHRRKSSGEHSSSIVTTNTDIIGKSRTSSCTSLGQAMQKNNSKLIEVSIEESHKLESTPSSGSRSFQNLKEFSELHSLFTPEETATHTIPYKEGNENARGYSVPYIYINQPAFSPPMNSPTPQTLQTEGKPRHNTMPDIGIRSLPQSLTLHSPGEYQPKIMLISPAHSNI